MGAAVLFAFVLFVMGGVTAYIGDRLGSYIGKKRRSSFGLRPRHTAMLWTVVSGGCHRRRDAAAPAACWTAPSKPPCCTARSSSLKNSSGASEPGSDAAQSGLRAAGAGG